jgi:hypothetical protein
LPSMSSTALCSFIFYLCLLPTALCRVLSDKPGYCQAVAKPWG